MKPIKYDNSLETIQDRIQHISKFNLDHLSERQLDAAASYILAAEKGHSILTRNRLATIHKRETALPAVFTKSVLGKTEFLTHKLSITDADVAEVPGLRELRDAIAITQMQLKHSSGTRRYTLRKQLIEMYRDQYVLKLAAKPPILQHAVARCGPCAFVTDDHIYIDASGEPVNTGTISFFDPAHIRALLKNYEALRTAAGQDGFCSDTWCILEDLDRLIEATFADHPKFKDILAARAYGFTNFETRDILKAKYGKSYSLPYMSSVWTKHIPEMIAEEAKRQYLEYYYTHIKPGRRKRCGRCGKLKLANTRNFARNSYSHDGLYSICKECRSTKRKGV